MSGLRGWNQLPKAAVPLNLRTILENGIGKDKRRGNDDDSENRQLPFAIIISMELEERTRSHFMSSLISPQ